LYFELNVFLPPRVELKAQMDLEQMLKYAAVEHRLGDKDKALWCILDYIAIDADRGDIYKTTHCIHFCPDDGWSYENDETKQ
jgi:hypothetical protein